MALRAFLSNPSIGGFGGESTLTLSQTRIGRQLDETGIGSEGAAATKNTARSLFHHDTSNVADNIACDPGNSCDAFAAIVKELVDNAVDACAGGAGTPVDNVAMHENGQVNEGRIVKRVRVTITAASVPVINNVKENNSRISGEDGSTTMSCLRIEVSDNGCGMDDIDYCVSVFSSNKTAGVKNGTDGNESGVMGKKSKSKAKHKPVSAHTLLPSPRNEKYTSGRYGVGLTLCLLHAQRLVPGTGACITSATASAHEWIRATYEPDTDADNIVCKKKERFPKMVGESGTTISLFVPGGDSARLAWPRLAEYFARFQLSTDLPCSLEVKAPVLQSRPLYIRPAAELERRIKNNRNYSLAADLSSVDEKSDGGKWEGGDGFDEGMSHDDRSNLQASKHPNTNRQCTEAEMQRNKKISLVHRAASTYKCRPDLKLENVAHAMQPIRRSNVACQSTTSENGSVLEVSLIVFGPDLEDDGDRREIETNSSKLHLVRMVNGIPLIDSSEALACGVMHKVSSSAATWNSFGLDVLQSNENDLEFDVKDSSQVAPFLKHSTHSLFEDHCRDHSGDEDDEDEFDKGTTQGKRKKESQRTCILPAALRLGYVLMVVQIRAKPSALPLPTLSKGRLPLNDKGINDALLNGISDCLRSLQRSSPGLLLTAHQLKKVERDVKYVPAVSIAIASILCRSRQRGVYDNALDIASTWNEEDKLENVEQSRLAPPTTETRNTPNPSHVNEEKLKIDALSQALERRLRFILSDEFKSSKIADEKALQRRNREDSATTKKRAKTKKAADAERMEIDCFESDDNCSSEEWSTAKPSKESSAEDQWNDRFDNTSFENNNFCQSQGESSTSSSSQPRVEPSRRNRGHLCSSNSGSAIDNFDDGYGSYE